MLKNNKMIRCELIDIITDNEFCTVDILLSLNGKNLYDVFLVLQELHNKKFSGNTLKSSIFQKIYYNDTFESGEKLYLFNAIESVEKNSLSVKYWKNQLTM